MISSTSTTDRLLTLSTAYFRSVQADFAHILSRPGLMVSATLRRQARRLERVFQRTRRPDDRASWILFVCSMHRRYMEKEGEKGRILGAQDLFQCGGHLTALDHFQGSPW